MIVSQQTRDYLSWNRILSRLESLASTQDGKAQVRELQWASTASKMRKRLQAVEELRSLFAEDHVLRFGDILELRPILARAEKEGILSCQELVDVAVTVQSFARIKHFLMAHQRRLSHSTAVVNRVAELRVVATEIAASINDEGEIRENASPELRRARQRAFAIHQDIKTRLERFLKTKKADEALQDKFYTLREDRYVVPVRAERQSTVEGIVHAVSQSGATVFVEPEFLISLNNKLKWAQEDVKRAESAILAELTEVISDHAGEIDATLQAVAEIDLLSARALMALEMDAACPQVTEESRLNLVQARSPLLLLQKTGVVANDFELSPENRRLLLLSGPNAGGKSVALKTLGQCLLMAGAGLLPPVGPDSAVPALTGLHALPGDLEDVSRQLSTFTGHLRGLNEILRRCRPGHLVLVDEITVGTEPEQGAALGAAYLDAFARSGALAVVATHYERLKALAMVNDGMENASMGVNWETLEPTYRMTVGAPGSSRTLEIARRAGVPEELLDYTQQILSGQATGTLEEAILRLSEKEEAIMSELDEARATRKKADALQQRRATALEELGKRVETIVNKKVRLATRELEQFLEDANNLLAEMTRKEQDRKAVTRNRRKLNEINEKLRRKRQEIEEEEATKPFRSQTASAFTQGGEVLVKKFGKKATIVSLSRKDKTAQLKMGPMKMRLPLSDLVPLETERPKAEPARTQTPRTTSGTGSQRLDLRGQSGPEALQALEQALDEAVLSPTAEIVVVHGHGTGKLKKVVRDYLNSTSYDVSFRPGKRPEGGDGVTIVSFG